MDWDSPGRMLQLMKQTNKEACCFGTAAKVVLEVMPGAGSVVASLIGGSGVFFFNCLKQTTLKVF